MELLRLSWGLRDFQTALSEGFKTFKKPTRAARSLSAWVRPDWGGVLNLGGPLWDLFQGSPFFEHPGSVGLRLLALAI